ncbi:MAG: DUF1877 family protein [Acidobacteria bacterium]|nr:DUF1877 family protein [Acidobacteriota bacterium]
MGVITLMYAIPPDKMRLIRRDHELLERVFGNEPAGPEWQFDSWDFDKHWEEVAGIMAECGHRGASRRINRQNFWDADAHEVWSVTPAAVRSIAAALAKADYKKIRARAEAIEITDYWGQKIPVAYLDGLVDEIRRVAEFTRQAAERGDFLLFLNE